jgi:Fe2+ transport system protein FeoA
VTSQTIISLNELEPGHKAWLNRAEIGRKLEKRLLALGFSNAIPLQIVHKRPGGLVVGIGNARIALGEDLAEQVKVVEE